MKATAKMVLSMTVFGTIGIFVRFLPFPSGAVAFMRGVIGVLFLLTLKLVKKEPTDFSAVKKNLLPLLVSGGCIGINWILLFESYRHTSVSTATLCYYMSPIFVTLLSPAVLKEKLTVKKAVCVFTAFIGMTAVSGIFTANALPDFSGILFGLGAAGFYAAVILTNKKIKEISDTDRTVFQLASAAAVILPYTLICEKTTAEMITPTSVAIMLAVGIIHTGIAYTLYFGAVAALPAQTTAVLGYIDPVVALILSAIFLSEPLDLSGYVGAFLILGSAVFSEISLKKTDRSL